MDYELDTAQMEKELEEWFSTVRYDDEDDEEEPNRLAKVIAAAKEAGRYASGQKALQFYCKKCSKAYFADSQDEIDAHKRECGAEEKDVRYVRTPAGARHFGQPIGTPIVADAPEVLYGAASGLSDAFQGDSGVHAHDHGSGALEAAVPGAQLTWQGNGIEGQSYSNNGIYSLLIDSDGYKIVVRDNSGTFGSNTHVLDSGPLAGKTMTAKQKEAQQILDARIEEYQARVENPDGSIFEWGYGLPGYDYWPDGSEVTDEQRERFEEDPDYRYQVALDVAESMGIDVYEGQNSRGEYVGLGTVELETMVQALIAMEEQHPGFIGLMDGIGTEAMPSPNTLAFNRGELIPYLESITSGEAGPDAHMKTGIYMNADFFGENPFAYHSMGRVDNHENWFAVHSPDVVDEYEYDTREQREEELWRTKIMGVIVHEIGHTFARIGLGEITLKDSTPRKGEKDPHVTFIDGLYNYFWEWGIFEDDRTVERFATDVRISKSNPLDAGQFKRAQVLEVLSLYGSSSIHELLAEAYAEYIVHPRPRAFSAGIGEMLDEAMDTFLKNKRKRAKEKAGSN